MTIKTHNPAGIPLGATINAVHNSINKSHNTFISQSRVLSIYDDGSKQFLTCGNSKGFMFNVRMDPRYNKIYCSADIIPWDINNLPDIEKHLGGSANHWLDYKWTKYNIIVSEISSETQLQQILKIYNPN